jgi:hypothetical protein
MLTVDLASGSFRYLPIVGRLLNVTAVYLAFLAYVVMFILNLQVGPG